MPDDLTPGAFAPLSVWRQAMQQWEQRGGRAILQIHTACTDDQKDWLRAFLGAYHA